MFQISRLSKNFRRWNNSGSILLEILVAIALVSIVFITLLGVGSLAMNVSSSIQKETQANSLIKEEFEALRNFRDGTQWATNGLGAVNTGSNNPYYLADNSNNWALVSGAETTGIFTRQVVFDKVSRDPGTQNIESAYDLSHDDPDTIKATVKVSWLDKTLQAVSYLTNWKND